jgi:hypothetical protein
MCIEGANITCWNVKKAEFPVEARRFGVETLINSSVNRA